MKNVKKFLLLLVTVLAAMAFAITAGAAEDDDFSYTKTAVLSKCVNSSKGASPYYVIATSNGSKISNVKSSNKSVVTTRLDNYDWGSSLRVTSAKKTGKATVSFKYKGKTYKTAVTVKKHANPISSLKIGSTKISSSKFNKKDSLTLKYSKYKNKNCKINIKLKKGWVLEVCNYWVNGKGSKFLVKGKWYDYSSQKLKNGKSSLKIKNKSYLALWCSNTKTEQQEMLFIYFR